MSVMCGGCGQKQVVKRGLRCAACTAEGKLPPTLDGLDQEALKGEVDPYLELEQLVRMLRSRRSVIEERLRGDVTAEADAMLALQIRDLARAIADASKQMLGFKKLGFDQQKSLTRAQKAAMIAPFFDTLTEEEQRGLLQDLTRRHNEKRGGKAAAG